MRAADGVVFLACCSLTCGAALRVPAPTKAPVRSLAPCSVVGRRAVVREVALPAGLFFLAAVAAAPEAEAEDRALYYTREDFCTKADGESSRGIEFGCEDYATGAKRGLMRDRAMAELDGSLAALERLSSASKDVRRSLRTGPLATTRRDAKRLVALSTDRVAQQALLDAFVLDLGTVDAAARKLEYGDSTAARLTLDSDLAVATKELRTFVENARRSTLVD